MRKSAMPPEVPVPNTESKPDHVKVGKHGADQARDPDPLEYLWPVETPSNAQGGDRMGDRRRPSYYFLLEPCSTLPLLVCELPKPIFRSIP